MKTRALFLLASTILIVGASGGCDACGKPKLDISDAAPASTLIADAATLNVTTVPTSDVQHMVNPDRLPAYAGPTGSVEGTIKVTGPAAEDQGVSSATYAGCPDAQKIYGKAFREGDVNAAGDARWLADAIIVVTGYSGFFVPEKDEAEEVTIDGCGYSRRTVTMTFGQRLEVKNLTNEFWTPELEPKSPGVMMMAPPHNTDPVKLYPKQAGRYLLVDHDRKYVVDDLMVFRHPLHAVSDMKGHYRIDGIPVGHVHVAVTHPRIPGSASTEDTDIVQGLVKNVDVTLNHKAVQPIGDAGGPDAFVPYPGLH